MQSLPTGTEAKKSPHSAGEPSSPATRAGTGLGAVVVLKALVLLLIAQYDLHY